MWKMLPCAILCGGLATRLRPVTEKLPKALIRVNGEPFIAHQLRLLRLKGVDRVVLCVGFLGEMIEDFVGTGVAFGVNVSYSSDGGVLLGTAGAIRNALPLLNGPFFVLYGDSYLTCDYARVAGAFQASGKRGLMTIYRNEGSFDSSNVEAVNGAILRYDKLNRTPDMTYIDYGLGAFHPSAFEPERAGAVTDMAGVYQQLLASGELASYEVTDRFYEAGSAQGIADLEQYLAKR